MSLLAVLAEASWPEQWDKFLGAESDIKFLPQPGDRLGCRLGDRLGRD